MRISERLDEGGMYEVGEGYLMRGRDIQRCHYKGECTLFTGVEDHASGVRIGKAVEFGHRGGVSWMIECPAHPDEGVYALEGSRIGLIRVGEVSD